LYLALPLALLEGPRERDNHYVRTLREYSERPGRYVELDRSVYQAGDTVDLLTTFTGEQLVVGGDSHGGSGLVSVRAVFVDSSTLQIEELHRHSAWRARDMASYAGLVLFLAISLGSLRARRGLPDADRGA
jgi:hypothetical protein